MRVDFYQLGGDPVEKVIASLAHKLLGQEERLLVVAEDQGQLTRLDRMLWDQGPTSFVPHAVTGGVDDARQPILLSSAADAPNRARNMLIADGIWREAALSFDRAFFLFDPASVHAAREAWRGLKDRDGVERHYWRQEEGKWVERG